MHVTQRSRGLRSTAVLLLTSGLVLAVSQLGTTSEADAGSLEPISSLNVAVHTGSEADAAYSGMVRRYCSACHNDVALTGNLSLTGFDVAMAEHSAEKAEKIVRKLAAGMMPPPGMTRPGGDSLVLLQRHLESRLDNFAAANPNPGQRSFQRLNRAEYQRAVADLLNLDIDPTA